MVGLSVEDSVAALEVPGAAASTINDAGSSVNTAAPPRASGLAMHLRRLAAEA
jgi:hypothetical protein